ncbi:hypothetical protein EQG49_11225 [Periweissella cryptocerci]|uniref:Tail spike domain-containing protein n=1 Tax=Periweissella cryptocerci TaxID=2506420 RepID=A0A4P6YVY5_9LACO|nr:phage tail protein [Periweissella cryptocerci]QBO36978.1 hypothetical protein EQG49_11225 [Periweissella cryptocerci]
MYEVTLRNGFDGQEQIIHSRFVGVPKLINPKIQMDVKAIDGMTFSVNYGQPGYDDINYLTSFIKVIRYGKDGSIRTVFEGRVLQSNPSFGADGVTLDVQVESLEAVLHDSTQLLIDLGVSTPRQFLTQLIATHNQSVDEWKQLHLGQVDLTDEVERWTAEDADSFDNIDQMLIQKIGGELRVRHEIDGLYLDYLKEISDQGSQPIRLADNLLSVGRSIDASNIYTVVKPLGMQYEGDSDETTAPPQRVNISDDSSVNGGSPYLVNQDGVNVFGRIVKVITYDDIDDPADLKVAGLADLAKGMEVTEATQLSAIDRSMIDRNVDEYVNGNYYPVFNPLIGLDGTTKRIVQMELDLNEPASSSMTVGDRTIGLEEYTKSLASSIQKATNGVQKVVSDVNSVRAIATKANRNSEDNKQLINELNTKVDGLQVGEGTDDDALKYTQAVRNIAGFEDIPTILGNVGFYRIEHVNGIDVLTFNPIGTNTMWRKTTALVQATNDEGYPIMDKYVPDGWRIIYGITEV